jgi:hypothetical protein
MSAVLTARSSTPDLAAVLNCVLAPRVPLRMEALRRPGTGDTAFG